VNWLERYTTPDSFVPAWGSVHRGLGRRLVTDSRSLLTIDDPAATLAPLELPGVKPGNRKFLDAILAEKTPADALVADLSDLWAWLDRVERERCPACTVLPLPPGAGCEECDGRRWVFPWREAGVDSVILCGLHLDRNRLAWWLAAELEPIGSRVALWASTAGSVASLAIDGGGWRLVVSALLEEYQRPGNRAYLPGAGAWWTCRRCPVARLSAADWAMDRGADPAGVFGAEQEVA
jgi:hypothetical protein